MKFKRLKDKCFELKDLEGFKEKLLKLDFIKIEGNKESGYLVLYKRDLTKWDRFFSKDWIFQIQQDIKLKTWWIMLTDNTLLNIGNFEELKKIIKLIEEEAILIVKE